MKTIRILTLTSLALLCLPASPRAQWFGAATWDISFPVEDTEKFVAEESFRGFGLDFRWQWRERTTFGLTTAWEIFHERTSESIEIENDTGGVTITGSQDRYINSFPIMLG